MAQLRPFTYLMHAEITFSPVCLSKRYIIAFSTSPFLWFTEITLALEPEEKAKRSPGCLQMEEFV